MSNDIGNNSSDDSGADPLDEKLVEVGRIGRAHGLQGWLRVAPASPALLAASHVRVAGATYQIAGRRSVPGAVLVSLAGVSDRKQAEALRGAMVAVLRSALPTLEPDEHWVDDLVGLRVVTMEGTSLGAVVEVPNYGTCDILRVVDETGHERLIPLTPGVLVEVRAEDGVMVVEPPEGLP